MTKPKPAPHPASALRAARIEQGLTLRALSARVGLPYSTVSKLETGKMAMTYDKLLRLTQGLGIDIAALLAGEARPEASPALGRRSIALAGKSANVLSARHRHQYPAADLLGKMMVPMLIEVHVRSVEELGGLVRHSGEEYLYVLSGAMELHSDLYAPLPLREGDSIYFDSGMAHAYVRVSDKPCRVLCVCAGPGIQRLAQSAAQSWTRAGPAGSDQELIEHDVSDIET